MANSSLTCVADATILIDFHWGQLLPELFLLPHQFLAPDLVIQEVRTLAAEDLIRYGLQEHPLSGDEVAYAYRLLQENRRLSVPDAFAYVLAHSKKATLLTGDGDLRSITTQNGVPVHGTLWALDEILSYRLAKSSRAAEALDEMLKHDSRLPRDECNERFRRWR